MKGIKPEAVVDHKAESQHRHDGVTAIGPIPVGEIQKCRVCGCTANDCRQCVAKTGHPCYWVEKDLCSACQEGASG